MQIDNLKEKVLSYEPTKESWRNKHSSIEWQLASQLNQEMHGMPLSLACMKCLDDLYITIHFRDKKISMQQKSQNKEIMEEKKFILKQGKVVTSHHFPHPIDQNSSEEDFIKLLRINKKHIDKFSKFPGNWEELINEKNVSLSKVSAPASKHSADIAKLKTTTEMDTFATANGIDISSATTNKERIALISEAMKPKSALKVVEDTDEAKADIRFHDRSIQLEELGYVVDQSADTFTKGDHVISGRDVYEVTDEEFAALLPTD